MANTRERPRLRFAPIPIETTFERYRKNIPTGELTPSPSPRSPSPPPREKRRFAPQLVESSVRRSRRAGDEGPATRPTDKTDITPYTNHIYAPKPKRRYTHGSEILGSEMHGSEMLDDMQSEEPVTPSRPKGHARRESCDDEIAGGFFDLVARDAQRKLQEVAMSAFPNSGQRIGGAEHFYVREGSEDDGFRGRATTRGPWNHLQSRRNSSQEDISWAFKEMQEHAQMVSMSRDMGRMSTLDLDNMSMDSPPSDAFGLTRAQRQSMSGSPLWTSSRPSSSSLGPIGETHMPLLRAESPLPTIGESAMPYIPPESPPVRPIGETFMPYIPSAPPGKAAGMPYAPASQIPPETSFGHQSPFMPYPQERDMSLERARNLHRLRARGSPPMLGQDLVFRKCPSPKQTKLEPDHLWDLENGRMMEDPNRDPTEEHGLWHGYCYTTDRSEKLAAFDRPAMLSTPLPPPTPGNPFAREFGLTAPVTLSEEPSPIDSLTRAGTMTAPTQSLLVLQIRPEHRSRNNQPKGLHMLQNLQGLDEKLKKEKEVSELEEKIAAEFDDKFVTQVYNYLSLGYPALARQYDEELSKISRISVGELEKDDDAIMENLWGADEHGQAQGYVGRGSFYGTDKDDNALRPVRAPRGKKIQATGHIMLDSEEKDGIREEDRCPRWKALKVYIYEWALQHPDLNAISPLAWGVGERRGSWGI
ncbi:hypothetical protein B0H67DRAFT_498669 [Lasiosphaeris hirsuta]|uniref:Uncharacterized protein n=1 Tax=Lasiosphaeris hirsuta TaxID=260670 RepID=A0AA39ZXV1_9PEZI|nr:hypothetical protein B0H67DRAFT_498669 [Lasiosphaeris hirsuta]